MSELSEELARALGALDTPTVCNALEVVDPNRRARGFNIKPLVCARPALPPVVAFARTARIRAQHRPAKPQDSVGYYTYIAEGGPLPSIAVIQDLDETPGYGALWGEVNTNVHYGLGCKGLVTNGSVRDIPDSAENFQMLAGMINPSHAWVHVVDWGMTVNVHGMECDDGDLVHADMHGACVIPIANAADVVTEADRIMKRERILINAAREPGFNMEKMKKAWAGMAEIH
ncbi:MAG: RraA family protein [Proteobacteria bacterium]|nr:RraA family protein [Pseudomonadota bacterium]MDA1299011.1 RraA family protein [Pseudomonadota bacterium]